MTAAEKLRMEIAQEAPFSKDEFISKISRLIKAYGYASFICDKHIRETDNWKRIARFHMTKTEILSLTPLRNGQEAMKMENGGMELPV